MQPKRSNIFNNPMQSWPVAVQAAIEAVPFPVFFMAPHRHLQPLDEPRWNHNVHVSPRGLIACGGEGPLYAFSPERGARRGAAAAATAAAVPERRAIPQWPFCRVGGLGLKTAWPCPYKLSWANGRTSYIRRGLEVIVALPSLRLRSHRLRFSWRFRVQSAKPSVPPPFHPNPVHLHQSS